MIRFLKDSSSWFNPLFIITRITSWSKAEVFIQGTFSSPMSEMFIRTSMIRREAYARLRDPMTYQRKNRQFLKICVFFTLAGIGWNREPSSTGIPNTRMP
jgi:hypothetical protein